MKPNPDMRVRAGLSSRRDNGRRSFAEPSNLMGQTYSQRFYIMDFVYSLNRIGNRLYVFELKVYSAYSRDDEKIYKLEATFAGACGKLGETLVKHAKMYYPGIVKSEYL